MLLLTLVGRSWVEGRVNIRRRLQVSNLLMIVVPVGVGLLVGVALIVAAWQLITGAGLGRSDMEDFSYEAAAASELAESALSEKDAALAAQKRSALEQALAANGLSLVVETAGQPSYSYGELPAGAAQLRDAVEGLTSPACVSSGSGALFFREASLDGDGLAVGVYGSVAFGSKRTTKAVLVVAGAALFGALLVSVLAANRFLTSFVLRHVTTPLDELAAGFDRVSDGDLAFRLPEGRDDEFASVYADFNRMTERLEVASERERQAGEQRRDLVVGLSHDLKSPLTSIKAYAEGLLDGIATTPEASERYLRTIVQKCDQMRGQIKKISLVFSMDSELSKEEPHPLDLAAFVTGWAAEGVGARALRGVDLCLDAASGDGGVWVLADEELLSRALDNLIDNCGKYARAGRASCSVVVRVSGCRLTVLDDGPGIPDAELSRAFDLFWRGDASRTSPAEGSGVGLAVVARAMEHMGGTAVAARSEELGGLSVTLDFSPAPHPADCLPPAKE